MTTVRPRGVMTAREFAGRWKTCLFPVLTCLTAAVLALLPPKLSELEDSRRAGVVQCEALPEDSNFPAAPPELPARIRLLAQWRQSPEEVAIAQQSVEEPEALQKAAVMMRAELSALTEAGVFPSGQPSFGENLTASRLYLRNLEDLSSAGFLEIRTSDRLNYDLTMTLDLETGRTLYFRFISSMDFSEELPAETVGTRFLHHLRGDEDLFWKGVPVDMDPETRKNPEQYAAFALPGCQCRYSVLSHRQIMEFVPKLEEVDTQVSVSGK